jgi:hypothetical protein
MASDVSDHTVRCLLVLNRDVTDRVLRAVFPQPVLGVRFVDAAADPEAVESAAGGEVGAVVVLHRAMYDASFPDDEDACGRLALLRRLSMHCVLVDPLDRVLPFADRGALCSLVARLAPTALQPRWLVVRDGEDATAAAVGAGLRLPIVCKPLLACGPPRSHELIVALRLSALREVPLPALLQEYIPHGGQILKLYCVGKHVHCEERPSLPDLRVTGEDGAQARPSGTASPCPAISGSNQATCGSVGGRGAWVRAWPGARPDQTPGAQAGTGDAADPLLPASVRFCTQQSPPPAAAFGAAAAPAETVFACRALGSESVTARPRGAGGGLGQGSTGQPVGECQPLVACESHRDEAMRLAGRNRDEAMRLAGRNRDEALRLVGKESHRDEAMRLAGKESHRDEAMRLAGKESHRDEAMRLAGGLARALGVGMLGVDIIVRAEGVGGRAEGGDNTEGVFGRAEGGENTSTASGGADQSDGVCRGGCGCTGACSHGQGGNDTSGRSCSSGCGGGLGSASASSGNHALSCSCASGCSGGADLGGVRVAAELFSRPVFSRLMVVDLNYMPKTSLRLADGGRSLAQLVLDRYRAHLEKAPP